MSDASQPLALPLRPSLPARVHDMDRTLLPFPATCPSAVSAAASAPSTAHRPRLPVGGTPSLLGALDERIRTLTVELAAARARASASDGALARLQRERAAAPAAHPAAESVPQPPSDSRVAVQTATPPPAPSDRTARSTVAGDPSSHYVAQRSTSYAGMPSLACATGPVAAVPLIPMRRGASTDAEATAVVPAGGAGGTDAGTTAERALADSAAALAARTATLAAAEAQLAADKCAADARVATASRRTAAVEAELVALRSATAAETDALRADAARLEATVASLRHQLDGAARERDAAVAMADAAVADALAAKASVAVAAAAEAAALRRCHELSESHGLGPGLGIGGAAVRALLDAETNARWGIVFAFMGTLSTLVHDDAVVAAEAAEYLQRLDEAEAARRLAKSTKSRSRRSSLAHTTAPPGCADADTAACDGTTKKRRKSSLVCGVGGVGGASDALPHHLAGAGADASPSPGALAGAALSALVMDVVAAGSAAASPSPTRLPMPMEMVGDDDVVVVAGSRSSSHPSASLLHDAVDADGTPSAHMPAGEAWEGSPPSRTPKERRSSHRSSRRGSSASTCAVDVPDDGTGISRERKKSQRRDAEGKEEEEKTPKTKKKRRSRSSSRAAEDGDGSYGGGHGGGGPPGGGGGAGAGGGEAGDSNACATAGGSDGGGVDGTHRDDSDTAHTNGGSDCGGSGGGAAADQSTAQGNPTNAGGPAAAGACTQPPTVFAVGPSHPAPAPTQPTPGGIAGAELLMAAVTSLLAGGFQVSAPTHFPHASGFSLAAMAPVGLPMGAVDRHSHSTGHPWGAAAAQLAQRRDSRSDARGSDDENASEGNPDSEGPGYEGWGRGGDTAMVTTVRRGPRGRAAANPRKLAAGMQTSASASGNAMEVAVGMDSLVSKAPAAPHLSPAAAMVPRLKAQPMAQPIHGTPSTTSVAVEYHVLPPAATLYPPTSLLSPGAALHTIRDPAVTAAAALCGDAPCTPRMEQCTPHDDDGGVILLSSKPLPRTARRVASPPRATAAVTAAAPLAHVQHRYGRVHGDTSLVLDTSDDSIRDRYDQPRRRSTARDPITAHVAPAAPHAGDTSGDGDDIDAILAAALRAGREAPLPPPSDSMSDLSALHANVSDRHSTYDGADSAADAAGAVSASVSAIYDASIDASGLGAVPAPPRPSDPSASLLGDDAECPPAVRRHDVDLSVEDPGYLFAPAPSTIMPALTRSLPALEGGHAAATASVREGSAASPCSAFVSAAFGADAVASARARVATMGAVTAPPHTRTAVGAASIGAPAGSLRGSVSLRPPPPGALARALSPRAVAAAGPGGGGRPPAADLRQPSTRGALTSPASPSPVGASAPAIKSPSPRIHGRAWDYGPQGDAAADPSPTPRTPRPPAPQQAWGSAAGGGPPGWGHQGAVALPSSPFSAAAAAAHCAAVSTFARAPSPASGAMPPGAANVLAPASSQAAAMAHTHPHPHFMVHSPSACSDTACAPPQSPPAPFTPTVPHCIHNRYANIARGIPQSTTEVPPPATAPLRLSVSPPSTRGAHPVQRRASPSGEGPSPPVVAAHARAFPTVESPSPAASASAVREPSGALAMTMARSHSLTSSRWSVATGDRVARFVWENELVDAYTVAAAAASAAAAAADAVAEGAVYTPASEEAELASAAAEWAAATAASGRTGGDLFDFCQRVDGDAVRRTLESVGPKHVWTDESGRVEMRREWIAPGDAAEDASPGGGETPGRTMFVFDGPWEVDHSVGDEDGWMYARALDCGLAADGSLRKLHWFDSSAVRLSLQRLWLLLFSLSCLGPVLWCIVSLSYCVLTCVYVVRTHHARASSTSAVVADGFANVAASTCGETRTESLQSLCTGLGSLLDRS